jgi:FixJ family two-component response regulator
MSISNPDPPENSLPTILFVDDEEKTRKHFKRLFQRQFNILLAEDGIEAFKVFQESIDKIGVIVTDQRMPNETGTEFLAKAALLKPGVVRILSTAYAEVEAAIDSVNKGGVYRYVTKPWEVPELEVTLTRAVELYELQHERDELVKQKMTSLQNLAASERIHSLAALAVFQNSGLRHSSRALQTLVQLADEPATQSPASSSEEPDWREAYRHHRHFLEVAATLFPQDLVTAATPETSQLVAAATILHEVCKTEDRFQWRESEHKGIAWPGPAEVVTPIAQRLFDGFGAILSQTDLVTATETEHGVEISLSSLSLRHGLQALVTPDFPDGPDKNNCLQLTAAFLQWTHHGGRMEILPNPSNRTVSLRLTMASPGNVTLAEDFL